MRRAPTSSGPLAACLDLGPDAYASHGTAAALWGLPGHRLTPVEVMVTRGRRTRSSIARVHHPVHLPSPFAAAIVGIPVVRPSLLLLQLAATAPAALLQRRLDWMWSRRLLSGPSVRAELDHVMHRGRPGVAALRALLDSLPDDYVPPASGLESRFVQVAADHDLPRMRRQADLGDEARWCGRVDFRALDLPLVVEVNGDLFHQALSNREDDERRRRRLEAAGFVVVELDEFQVWHRTDEVVERVRKAAGRRGSRWPTAAPPPDLCPYR